MRVKIAFRQLLDKLGSIRLIAEYLDQQMPQRCCASRCGKGSRRKPANCSAGRWLLRRLGRLHRSQAHRNLPAAHPGMAVDGQIATLMQQQLQAVTQLIQSQLQILRGTSACGSVGQAGDATVQPVQQKSVADSNRLRGGSLPHPLLIRSRLAEHPLHANSQLRQLDIKP